MTVDLKPWPKQIQNPPETISLMKYDTETGYVIGFNACHNAFMKIIESEQMVNDISIHGQSISKDGERIDPRDFYIDSQPQLIPLDYDRDLKQLFDDVYNRKIINHSELKAKCSTFGQSKEKLVPLNEKELTIGLNRERLAEILYLKSSEYPQREIPWGFLEDFKKEYYLSDADAIIAEESTLIEVKEEK